MITGVAATLLGGRADGMTCKVTRWPDHVGGQPARLLWVTVIDGAAHVLDLTDRGAAGLLDRAEAWEVYELTGGTAADGFVYTIDP